MKLTVGKHSIDLSRPVVMTIINATPDSFYEGSRTPRADDVARRAERAVADGAAILDVGGYSSRPSADDVTPDEELRRVTRALETIRRRCPDTPVSIDTFRSEVAEGAIERFGPCIVNDITAGTADPAIAAVAARHGVPLIAMHMRGTPQTMQTMTRYDDLTGEVLAYCVEKLGWLRGADRARPGFRLFENRGAELPPAGRNAPAWRTGLSGSGRHIPQVDDIQDARHDAGRRPRRHDGAALGMPASGRIDPARARHARGGANRRAVRTVRTIQ